MQKLKELEQRINRLDQEKAALRHQISKEKRQGDAKRKILYGIAALSLAEQDSAILERLHAYLDRTVKRPNDREILGLPALEGEGDD